MKRLFLVLLLVSIVACGREDEHVFDDTDGLPKNVSFTLASDLAWGNTGVKVHPKQRIKIVPDAAQRDDAVGRPEANFRAPLPAFGSFGLIAKIGEYGLPMPVGEGLEIQGSSMNSGESLFLGRNGKPSDFAEPQTTDTTEDSDEVAKVALTPLRVNIALTATDAPTLLAPVNGFFTSNDSPTFDWDDVENAWKYVFELSRFPDFRDQELALELSTGSSVSLANFTADSGTGQPTFPGQNNPAASLPEGLYYWRVRAQVNYGRTIAPTFRWTAHSAVGWFGVESKTKVGNPRILAPLDGARFAGGQVVLLEFTQPPDPSGLFWRYKSYTGACGSTLSASSSQQVTVSAWHVFRSNFASNILGEVPPRYGAKALEDLDTGEYLVEVEVLDGADGKALNLARAGRTTVSFSVGCQN